MPGGSLLATFETSLYTERNERRSNFALADVFGISKTGEVIGTAGNGYLARIEKPHEIIRGFSGTNWIPGAENRVPIAPVDGPILTVVPGFVAYPPELSYPLQPRTDEPAAVVGQRGEAAWSTFLETSNGLCGVPVTPIWRGSCKTPSGGLRAPIRR